VIERRPMTFDEQNLIEIEQWIGERYYAAKSTHLLEKLESPFHVYDLNLVAETLESLQIRSHL
jgi:hypothetical protein